MTSCDLSCQRQPLSLSSVAFNVLFLLPASQFAFKIYPRSVCSSPHFICNTYITWVALVRVPICAQRRSTYFLVQVGSSSSRCSWPQDYCSPWYSSCVFRFPIPQINCFSPPTDHHVLRLGMRLYQPNRSL